MNSAGPEGWAEDVLLDDSPGEPDGAGLRMRGTSFMPSPWPGWSCRYSFLGAFARRQGLTALIAVSERKDFVT